MIQLVMIGAGNLAWHLAPAFDQAGHAVRAVFSRDLVRARQLTQNLYDAQPVSTLNFADSPARLFVLAVPDDALEAVCRDLVLPPHALVVHTSGTQPLGRLVDWLAAHGNGSARAGVFYALQTFSREQPALSLAEVPLCIEATDPGTEAELLALARCLSRLVYLVDSAQRRTLHLSAVLAANFTNHLLAIAKDQTDAAGLAFVLLHPLILETVRKALSAPHPAEVQTGPARRHDHTTIAAHRAMLADRLALEQVYRVLSDSIEARY